MLLTAMFCNIIIALRELVKKHGSLRKLKRKYVCGELTGNDLHSFEKAAYSLFIYFGWFYII